MEWDVLWLTQGATLGSLRKRFLRTEVVSLYKRGARRFGGERPRLGAMNAQELLQEIADYCRHSGLAESTFGRRAVNDGKLAQRLRNGGRITTETLDRIREFMENNRTVAPRAAVIERAREPRPAPVPAAPAPAQPGPRDPQRNFRFFDNRQKYLLFVSTCSEKWVVASRVALELANVHPRPPALRVFDAGVGDGTVLLRVLRVGDSAYRFEQQFTDLVPFLSQNWKAGVSPKTGNPVYERPVVLVLYRADHKFLLDPIIPRPGGTMANYDLVIASQPYRARAPLEFKARRVIAPLAKALGPGGRLIAIHSHGNDPGMDIIQRVWPGDNPFIHDRHQIMKVVKHELGPAGRDLNFNAYADNRSLFRYEMHTLPSEISDQSIGTSTLFAAWNAAIYVAQVEDDRLAEVVADGRYLDATREVLREHGGLWFYDESYVISRRRE